MENASKALLMGAGVLLAVLLMAIMVRLFNSAATVTQSYQSREVAAEIATFNANFTRFIGGVKGNNNTVTQSYATIYDIISVGSFYTMEDLENRIQINDNRILIYRISEGYAKPTYTIMEGFIENGDVIKAKMTQTPLMNITKNYKRVEFCVI